ncbi:acyltransferase family protein [Bacillus suaedae]|uniref:Acyltransferase n=1 Tax=Halalkalibacter suaedae TaxID=2822140 RepID=A0A941AQQ7_9BACI|nr:acyltransferase [Bacillus suaedae]MBP3951508.1 acyltransferase [Bacillus suaedae]
MELSKDETKILKGFAIMFMVLLHLFCRKDIDGYYNSFFMIGDIPIEYYVGLFGDACRPIYLFVTGYAFYTVFLSRSVGASFRKNLMRIFKLFINYWIVLFLFLLIGFAVGKGDFFVSIWRFILSFTLIDYSYNGAWWFLQVYIIIVLLSPFLINLTKKSRFIYLFLISGSIYFTSHFQVHRGIFDLALPQDVEKLLFLLGTSQFSFLVGGLFAKYKIISKLRIKSQHIRFKNMLGITGIVGLVIFHGFIESAIIAPINAVGFICLFTLMNKSVQANNFLGYLSSHSTNIWLTHMFFYITFFKDLTFMSKNPVIIFIWLMFMCIVTSHLIKLIYNPISSAIDRRVEQRQIMLNKDRSLKAV